VKEAGLGVSKEKSGRNAGENISGKAYWTVGSLKKKAGRNGAGVPLPKGARLELLILVHRSV